MRWVAENLRPFAVVKDRGFIHLMKTGRLYDFWLPSPKKVAEDVVVVWLNCRERIADMLKVSGRSFERL